VSGVAVHAHATPNRWLLPALCLLLAVLMVASMASGPVSIPLLQGLAEAWSEGDGVAGVIMAEIRLPRTLLAALVGASLALAGAAMQGLLRNALAEPGIVGVSSSAALGSVIVIYFGFSQLASWLLPLGGMIGAAAGVTVILALAGRDATPLTVILAGVAVNAFANAMTALALNLAPSPYAVLEIVFWLLGSLADRSMDHLWLALPPTLLGWLLLLSVRRPLDALTLGEEVAQSLGFEIARVRLTVVAGTAACVGAAVAVSGAIGFVGLVVPHLLRPLVGHEPGRLLPVSALGGACLLLASDIAVRTIETDTELKLGVVTSMIGAPFFLYLIVKTRRALI
jgi:iron complex transport system permease protein